VPAAQQRDEKVAVAGSIPFAYRLSPATQGMRRSGSTALDLAYVAAGRLEAF
jgi:fructose-1,6-bisphosphatase/inositol monophosphatase family enzyme